METVRALEVVIDNRRDSALQEAMLEIERLRMTSEDMRSERKRMQEQDAEVFGLIYDIADVQHDAEYLGDHLHTTLCHLTRNVPELRRAIYDLTDRANWVLNRLINIFRDRQQ